MSKVKEYTEKQQAFLDALFGEAQYDYAKAKELAGYAATTPISVIVGSLSDEIIARSKMMLAMHTPKAAAKLTGMIDGDLDPNTNTRIKAIAEVMDRAGLSKKEEVKVDTDGMSAVLILPAKRDD